MDILMVFLLFFGERGRSFKGIYCVLVCVVLGCVGVIFIDICFLFSLRFGFGLIKFRLGGICCFLRINIDLISLVRLDEVLVWFMFVFIELMYRFCGFCFFLKMWFKDCVLVLLFVLVFVLWVLMYSVL